MIPDVANRKSLKVQGTVVDRCTRHLKQAWGAYFARAMLVQRTVQIHIWVRHDLDHTQVALAVQEALDTCKQWLGVSCHNIAVVPKTEPLPARLQEIRNRHCEAIQVRYVLWEPDSSTFDDSIAIDRK